MSKEKLEKLEREKYVVERKLTAAMHKEKRLQSELKRLTRSGRTHRLCTRAGMLETFLKEPTTLTDDDVMELLTFIFHSEAIQKKLDVPFPVSWTVKMKKKQKETQDILSYHTQAAGCSDKARAKASGGRQPIEECGRTGL